MLKHDFFEDMEDSNHFMELSIIKEISKIIYPINLLFFK